MDREGQRSSLEAALHRLTYQPMLEVLSFFRANGYKTYIVTGGGQDFVRVYSDHVYGIPPEQVVGSAAGLKYGYDKTAGRSSPGSRSCS